MDAERGYTLVEIIIAVGIIALVAATGAGLTLATRSLAVAAAASEFDALLDGARTVARNVAGGVLIFAPDGDGTTVTLYAHALDGTLVPTALPALRTRAHIAERERLGDPSFSLVIHANGRVGGIPHTAAAEIGCPASGSFHFLISAGGGSADRYVPCRLALAVSGPLAYVSVPPAAADTSSPAPCANACIPAPLPVVPSASPTCPSGYITAGPRCVPTPTPIPTPTAKPTSTPTPTPTSTPAATPAPTATPIAATCDLVKDQICYRRILGQTLELFDKTVTPAYTCDELGLLCEWQNRIGLVQISTRQSYSFQPPIAAKDSAHQILFVVDGVGAIRGNCASFQAISDYAPSPPVQLNWINVISGLNGGNLQLFGSTARGYGQPSVYAYRHQTFRSPFQANGPIVQSDFDATQDSRPIEDFVTATQTPLFGSTVTSTYSDPNFSQGDFVTYVPDFTDCASGSPTDHVPNDQWYGITTAGIILEAYQAVPQ